MTRSDLPDGYRFGNELDVFGSCGDSRPDPVLGQHAPVDAAWMRTFVVADNIGTAVARLEQIHLTRPIETLTEVESGDWIGAAIGRTVRSHLATFQPFVYIAVALAGDPGHPLVFELNAERTAFVEAGRVDLGENGPDVFPRAGWGTRPDETLPLGGGL